MEQDNKGEWVRYDDISFIIEERNDLLDRVYDQDWEYKNLKGQLFTLSHKQSDCKFCVLTYVLIQTIVFCGIIAFILKG